MLLVVLGGSACSWTDGPDDTSPAAGPDAERALLVTVPQVTQTSVTEAYKRLREAGLRVAIPERFTVAALHEPGPSTQRPRAGQRVPPGTVVTLELWPGPLGSPAYSPHTVTVSDLVGLSASEALEWVEDADLFFEIRDIPPLLPSDAAGLFDNYRVTAQSPAPGTRLGPGVLPEGGGFLPTPVILTVSPLAGA
jgi:beta-lactam-binding protein with PASTA domain